MKNNFNHAQKGWDRFTAFHTWDRLFTSFETGEVRMDAWRFEPHERTYHEKYNVTLTATSDQSNIIYVHPFTGKQIPKAQLTFGGLQYLVVDHNTKKALSINGGLTRPKLPRHLQGANIWTLSSESEVFSTGQVRVNAPTVITPEMVAWKKTVEVLAKMRGTAIQKPSNYYRHGNSTKYSASTTKMTPYDFVEKCLDPKQSYMSRAFHDINDYGIEFTRDPEPLDYLMVDFKK
jgi:hypothetical protein